VGTYWNAEATKRGALEMVASVSERQGRIRWKPQRLREILGGGSDIKNTNIAGLIL